MDDTRSESPIQGHADHTDRSSGRGHSSWGMIACCIPMLVIAVVLVVTGVVGVGFLVFAVACTLMMALMMRGSGHESHPSG